MKILVIGEAARLDECRAKLGTHDYMHITTHDGLEDHLTACDAVFDFRIGEHPAVFSRYADNRIIAFLNVWRTSLAALIFQLGRRPLCTAFGFNGFPTLFNREYLEVSVSTPDDLPVLEKVCNSLNTPYLLVEDRVGLVTPRVISMIINEAYYTVQEGTASRDDIDLAMKLGTNYPFGPFEWCEKMGLKNVYELLQAVYEDTHDERYKISALMRREYLMP